MHHTSISDNISPFVCCDTMNSELEKKHSSIFCVCTAYVCVLYIFYSLLALCVYVNQKKRKVLCVCLFGCCTLALATQQMGGPKVGRGVFGGRVKLSDALTDLRVLPLPPHILKRISLRVPSELVANATPYGNNHINPTQMGDMLKEMEGFGWVFCCRT